MDDAEFFEISLDLMCVAGFDGYWKRVNRAWTRTLGWTREELLSRPILDFVHPEDRKGVLAARAELFRGVPLVGLQNRYLCRDGSHRWLEWRSAPHPERGEVYAVARDITEQRELERRLALADRLASVGTMAAGVAHEVNNPLAFVASNLDVVLEELEGGREPRPEEWAGMLREARRGCDRIGRIVRALRTFSRADEERRSVLAIRPILEFSLAMAGNEIRHRARLVRDYGALPSVEADDSRLGQVFINLLVNAAQALPDGNSESNEIRVRTFTGAGGEAVLEFLDTGPGIPSELLPRVFEPFFTTKPVGAGTGLGLSICHHIVTALGGRLEAENRPEGGALFRVTLPPAAAPPPTEDSGVAAEPSRSGASARVLVVDDEPAIRGILRRALRDHEVTEVDSGGEALDLLERESFDVVLSDLMMPGMSGVEFYERLAADRPDAAARVVFMTGGAFTPAADAFLERVSNERLSKPFDLRVLRETVERYAPAPLARAAPPAPGYSRDQEPGGERAGSCSDC